MGSFALKLPDICFLNFDYQKFIEALNIMYPMYLTFMMMCVATPNVVLIHFYVL